MENLVQFIKDKYLKGNNMNNVLYTGEVWKLKNGYIVIITERLENRANWISFNHSNCSGTTYYESYMSKEPIYDNCDCHTGEYEEVERPGFDKATRLASSVSQYILNCLLKNFDFNLEDL